MVRNGSRSPCSAASPSQHGADALQPAGVDVVQHDLVERQPLALRQQRPVDERDAEPAAADDRELHQWDGIRTEPSRRPPLTRLTAHLQ